MPLFKFDDIAENLTAKRKPTEADMQTYIGLEHLESGSLFVHNFGSDVPIKGEKLIMTRGDILLGKRNAYLKRAAIAPHDGLFSAHGMILRPKEKVIDKRFFPFFIASDVFFDEAIRISVGSLSPTINWRDLKELEFNLPPIEEQRKLADLLWSAYDLKESYKRLLAASDEMAKSRFVEMFGDKIKERVYLGNYSEITGGITKNARRENLPLKMPYLRVANVFFNAIDTSELLRIGVTEEEYAKTLLKNNDLLFVEGNGSPDQIGRVALWDARITPCLHQNHLIRVRLDKSFNPCFVLHYFMSQEGRRQIITSAVSTSGLHTLSVGKISKFTLPKPDLKQQNEFVTFVEQLDKSKVALQKSIDNIDTLVKSLLNTINSENTK